MKKGFKMFLMCIVVVLPILCLSFMAKAENKEVSISALYIPKNGSDDKHLVCGSDMTFEVKINSEKINENDASIEWKVTKKDGTVMKAVYETRDNGKSLNVYAPYGHPEDLEVSVCVNGNAAWTDTYAFETYENEKMAGKTFFQFDTEKLKDTVTCDTFVEEWNADKQSYTVTIPGIVSKDKSIQFLGWSDGEGQYYKEGERITFPSSKGLVHMSIWFERTNEPTGTELPDVTTDPTTTIAPTDVPKGSKEVSISPLYIPKNGSDDKHLVCGSDMTFAVNLNSEKINQDDASIEWKVTKKDGTAMQAVYETRDNGKSLNVYAPYGYPEDLEVSVCVNGNVAWTDTYTFETYENEKMVGKTFFQFDTGKLKDIVECDTFVEEWNADEQSYTITIPGIVSKDKSVQFLGWTDSEGQHYKEGERITFPAKSGIEIMSIWFEMTNEPTGTELPDATTEPDITTDPVSTVAPTGIPQSSKIPSMTPQNTIEPTKSVTPQVTAEPIVTASPTIAPTSDPTNTPDLTTQLPVTEKPMTSAVPTVTKTPEVTQTPVVTVSPTNKPESKIKTVSKITAKKAGSKKITVTWNKVSNAKGYRIAYSTNKNFKKNYTKYKTITATKATLTKLTKKKTYYIKVCAYKIVDGKKVYGPYSKVKKVSLK